MKKHTKRLVALLLTVMSLTSLLTACNKSNNSQTVTTTEPVTTANTSKYVRSEEESSLVMFKMADGGDIVIELAEQDAPITTDNFKKLVKEKFYNNLSFHRAVPGFVIQGGDPNGDGTGGSKDTITGEFADNGVENKLADNHERGVVSMARAISMDSASSQFFIVLDTNSNVAASLNGKYAAFGRVIEGMEIVDKIASLETQNQMIKVQPKIQEAYFVKRNAK